MIHRSTLPPLHAAAGSMFCIYYRAHSRAHKKKNKKCVDNFFIFVKNIL